MNGAKRLALTVWRSLTSMRLTVLLLAALTVVLLTASFFPQLPPNSDARAPWLEAVALRYRQATPLIRYFGLFETFRAPWFFALVAGLILNLVACTAQRLVRLWRLLARPPTIARPEEFYRGRVHRREWPVSSLEQGIQAAESALRRYRLYTEFDEAAQCGNLFAVRGRWSRVGTLLSHAATAALLLAVIARPVMAWQEQDIVLVPGQERSVGGRAPFAVRAGVLSVDLHSDGQPSELRAPLAVLVQGSAVLTETVRINHPLEYRGVSFHLQGYGPAARLTTAEDARSVPLFGVEPQEIGLPGSGIVLRVAQQTATDVLDTAGTRGLYVEARTASGTILGSGWVADGQEITVQGHALLFSIDTYTVWQASHDPTYGPAVVAAALLLVGIMVSFLASYRRVWIRVDEHVALMVGAGAHRGELDDLADEIARASCSDGPASD